MKHDHLLARKHEESGVSSKALYSVCERYRFSLQRVWAKEQSRVLFVMLNPSTATELKNDPTVERCERRARQMNCGSFRVCNLFAWRATRPKSLLLVDDPVGVANDDIIIESARWADLVICAWGANGAYQDRGRRVEAMLRDTAGSLCHLGLTKDGHPRHPLYLAYTALPVPWPEEPGHPESPR